MTMRYAAVLFDLDGTLLDTLEDIADSANRALASLHFPTHPVDNYRTMVGDGVVKLIERALPAGHRDQSTVRACIEAYRQDYSSNWHVKSRPYQGIPQLLDELSTRGLKLAVLSNKPDEFTQACVSHFLARWKFDLVAGQTADIPVKPDPMGALKVADRLGVAPSAFLYLGDSAVDMRTALAAGMMPVGALWGFRSRGELEAAGAQALLQAPGELLRLLK